MKLYKIPRPLFSTIPDDALDSIIKQYKDSHPKTGIRYIHGTLFQQGIRVQRNQVEASLSHVDDVGRVILCNKIIKRREYKSIRPNALWHVDGHHKLGPWGIVIHGFTDGYDRVVSQYSAVLVATAESMLLSLKITGMRVSSSNTAQTVLKLFLQAIKEFGCPSRVRGDRGAENVDLCTWMILYRGPNRASFMWGT